ncbi:hypothetical protein [Symbiopectobacterium purcellii]|uniref:Uncharacterized protein n=1 Tax=Symbiopectobacterium purcellii TaxID=2871826 RepID=A0ABX9AWJ2_9ENTR|nr:hypothetical protein [Symbiopectobacterium purcellii]QZN97809.1 hypothetical protein K6K13_11185 [Symbiopectobacterium purcellii]
MIIPENENCYGLVVEDLGDMLTIGDDGLAIDTEQAQQLIVVLQRWVDNEDIED